jgi:hypothetical protein
VNARLYGLVFGTANVRDSMTRTDGLVPRDEAHIAVGRRDADPGHAVLLSAHVHCSGVIRSVAPAPLW